MSICNPKRRRSKQIPHKRKPSKQMRPKQKPSKRVRHKRKPSKQMRPKRKSSKQLPLRAAVMFYYAQSPGGKRDFRIKDAVAGFRSRLPAPHTYSYAHVYVDGILQSPLTYRLRTGRLLFRSPTLPPAGAHITAEFIAVYPQTKIAPRPSNKKAPSSPKSRPRKKKLCCCKKRKKITKR